MFIWLGSGRARKHGVSEKGQLLDKAAQAGLPVPHGAILLDSFYRFLVEEQVVQVTNRNVTISDPELLHNTLFFSVRLPRFDHPVVLSPILDSVLLSDSSMVIPGVDLKQTGTTAHALEKVWTIYESNDPSTRRDVLLIERPKIRIGGIATSREGGETDQVKIFETPDNEQFDNRKTGKQIELPHLKRFQAPDSNRPPYERRLQMLLRGVRRTFGEGDWMIDWADDGRICWLLTAAPI